MPTTIHSDNKQDDHHEDHHENQFARCMESNKISAGAPFHWLALAVKDLVRAPIISLIFGLVFTMIPAAIMYFTYAMETHLMILPAIVAFALIGPVFAVGLYDVSWELEKNHKPSLSHSVKSLFRNPVSEWGFAIVLTLLMIAWMRIATLIHALYPTIGQPSFSELAGFLIVGTSVGTILLAVVFAISAFTPQICLERKVDLMTAIFSSVNAVRNNVVPMLVWAFLILVLVVIGFLTATLGFIIIMPILSFASWHAYIAVIKTKKPRSYE